MKTVSGMVLAVCGLLCGLPLAPLPAQGIPRGARVARTATVAQRLLVANPFVSGAADSAAAVEVGAAIRDGVQDRVGDDYAVVTQQEMNEALRQYGFSPDANLAPALAQRLAKSVGARAVVTSTMTKAGDRYTVTARLTGMGDDVGSVVEVPRQPGERLADFGARIAKTVRPAVEALDDARACMDEREAKPAKAAQAAAKALKKVPSHGLAHFCLYRIAEQQKAPRQDALEHLEAAVKGDPQSVPAWQLLFTAYQEAKDSVNALAAAKQLLRIAPTDRDLRERVFRYFLDAGQSKAALEVADEGIAADSLDAELYDLRANACLFLRDFPCAMHALERMYAIDSSTADTLFFVKAAATALAGTAPDTARLLAWSQTGARKFPDNPTILGYLNQAYTLTGQIDSGVVVTQRIIARDTTAVVPALVVVRALAQSNRMVEAAPFVDFVRRYGNQAQKQQLARVVVAVSLTRLQGDSATSQAPDFVAAADLARTVIAIADSTSEEAQHGNFVLGAALFRQGAELDPQIVKQKSCEMARQERQLMVDANAALTSVTLERYNTPKQQYLKYVDQYSARAAAMVKKYCR